MPDIFVAIDTSSYPAGVNRLLLDGSFNNFVYNYFLGHKQAVNKFGTAADYTEGFSGTNEMWDQFVNYAAKDSINLKNISEKDKAQLQRRLKAYLARFKWRNAGYYQVLNNDDLVIKKAVEEIKK
jgi:carboxyl-terminal processing protease